MPSLSFQTNQRQEQTMTLSQQQRQRLEILQAPAALLAEQIRVEAMDNPVLEISGPESSLTGMREEYEREQGEREEVPSEDDFSRDSFFTEGAESVEESVAPEGTAELSSDPDDFAALANIENVDDYFVDGGNNEYNPDAEERHQFMLDSIPARESLYDHILAQLANIPTSERRGEVPDLSSGEQAEALALPPLNPLDLLLAFQIATHIDTDGYFRTPMADIAQAVCSDLRAAKNDPIFATAPDGEADVILKASSGILFPTLAEVLEFCGERLPDATYVVRRGERILTEVFQGFSPLGICARSARECLLLQARESFKGRLSLKLLENTEAAEALARGDVAEVLRLTEATEEEFQAALRALQTLDPLPGRQFSAERPVYVSAEIIVKKIAGHWTALLDDSELPQLSVSPLYREMLQSLRAEDLGAGSSKRTSRKGDENAEARRELEDYLKRADDLIAAVSDRRKTLAQTARLIVDAQQDYFELGPEFLKPLTLKDIAHQMELDESTISRAVGGKYFRCKYGVKPLDSLFANGLQTSSGSAVTPQYIQALIRKLVDEEDAAKPLSDDALATALKKQGIQVERRTINKYRGILGIPSARERANESNRRK